MRTSVYRRTAVTGAGSLDLRNFVIDDITDGEPTQHGTATNTYDGHLRRVKQTSPRGTFYSIYNLAGQLIYQDNITKNERTDYISVGAEPVVRMIDGVRIAYVHANHLGSTIAESDTNGDIRPCRGLLCRFAGHRISCDGYGQRGSSCIARLGR